ncbi:YrhK family protein [Hoeflea sp. YIM 152468]|uniref:YrhK family protein n=1 Tax=Hoeflea sp. YIM 152468 TaxID=3031759 RepID=UPI0023D9B84A|nr:YrhK family protein [Hoeflea sp. YIM 152468]MDF1607123.1 YrhK family protein [Hoeflea sp. YIM 152468]
MALFKLSRHRKYVSDERYYAWFELAYTAVDVCAAGLFVIGSVMFFFEEWQKVGTWCFLIGSICFALKPVLRIIRELRYLEKDDYEDLAKRLKDDP